MKPSTACLQGLALLLCLSTAAPLLAASSCEAEAQWAAADGERHFMILAGRSGVFYDRSGPAFVALIKAEREQSAMGAIGIYAGAGNQPAFGAVPAAVYEELLQGPHKTADVVLRLEISGPQYERVLKVLEHWDRRVRENALLYPQIALDNILLVKQATEELNRCSRTLIAHDLDWGLEDDISENNAASLVPFEYFKELKQLNEARHVPVDKLPAALLSVADTKPAHGG